MRLGRRRRRAESEEELLDDVAQTVEALRSLSSRLTAEADQAAHIADRLEKEQR